MDKELLATLSDTKAAPASDAVSPTLKGNKEIEQVKYTPEEIAFRSSLIQTLMLAQEKRDMKHPELDYMTYLDYYESNKRKDLSFMPPKENKQDVRIVTGITREKDSTLLNALLNMNLRPEITAFDHDDMVVNELGDSISDMVKKSRDLEAWEEKRSIIYRELISQGDVFVQELYKEDFRKVPVGEIKWDPTKDKVADLDFKERLQKIFEGPEARMVNGKKVYLFNIREPYAHKQPGVAVLNIYPRSQAEARYGNWERWENVPYGVNTVDTQWSDGATYKDWNLVALDSKDYVAEIMIYWAEKNRFQIMLNGVMMLPMNYPLTAVCPTGEIPLAQGKLEPIADFAYSKSQPSKMKIDQEVADEVKKLMVEKMRQSFKPPMGSRGKKVYSSSIFLAGKITNEIGEGDLFPLLGDKFSSGVTVADFSFYKLVNEDIDKKSTSPNFSGQEGKEGQTATETIEMKNQAMLSLGLALDGVVNLERRMTWNRIYTILTKWTAKCEPHIDDVKKGIYDGYRTFSMNAQVEGGQNGVKVFRMTTGAYPNPRDHEQEEEDMSKAHGKPVRIIYLNPEMLRSIKYKWFILINPSPKSNDSLTQLLFMQNLQTALEVFGPDSLNMDYVKQRFAILINEDYNKFFKKMTMQDMLNQGLNSPAAMQAANAQKQGMAAAGGDQGGGQGGPVPGRNKKGFPTGKGLQPVQ